MLLVTLLSRYLQCCDNKKKFWLVDKPPTRAVNTGALFTRPVFTTCDHRSYESAFTYRHTHRRLP